MNRHSLIVVKLVLLLLFTVNDSAFEFKPFIEHILNEYYMMRLFALYMLCLTYIAAADEEVSAWDFVDSLIATCFFLLFIHPGNITKSVREQSVSSIPLDRLSGDSLK